jgi:thiol-disulfide isomerase/thioredoxin
METVNVVWIIIGLSFIVGLCYYIYKKYIRIDNKAFVPNSEYTSDIKKYECILFYTSWCPHCKQTIKDWGQYKTNDPIEGGTYTEIDCDKNPDKADFYQIESYPTIIMIVKDKKYVFDSNFSKESMDKFVETILKL